jgi:hypothetical protein
MKKLLFVGLLIGVAPCIAFDTDRVEEAIEQLSLSKVKSQCNKIDRNESLTAQARKKLYRHLYGLATDSTKERTDSLSLFVSWRDMAKVASGSILACIGMPLIIGGLGISSPIERRRLDIVPLAIAAGSVAEAIGIYLLYKGITCSAQRAEIDMAKSIEKYLKGKLNSEEFIVE